MVNVRKNVYLIKSELTEFVYVKMMLYSIIILINVVNPIKKSLISNVLINVYKIKKELMVYVSINVYQIK